MRGRIYNNFYTPELWEQVNKTKELLMTFLQNINRGKNQKERLVDIIMILGL